MLLASSGVEVGGGAEYSPRPAPPPRQSPTEASRLCAPSPSAVGLGIQQSPRVSLSPLEVAPSSSEGLRLCSARLPVVSVCVFSSRVTVGLLFKQMGHMRCQPPLLGLLGGNAPSACPDHHQALFLQVQR